MTSSPRPGKDTSAPPRARAGLAESVRTDEQRLHPRLQNGREVSTRLTARLKAATPEQRALWQIEDFGAWLHWEELDEDIGVAQVIGVSEDEVYDLAGFERHDED